MNAAVMNEQDAPSLSIAQRAMLVDLTIHTWNASVVDREATQTVHAKYEANEHAGRYHKRLFPIAPASLSAVRALLGATGVAHRRLTLPWHDGGHRILPRAMFHQYAETVRKYREKVDAAVAEFVAEYPTLKNDAAKMLGDMYDESNYPLPSEVAQRFGIHVAFMPLPTADDFRISLDAQEQAQLRKAYESDVSELMSRARQDAYQRIADALGTFQTRLYRMHSMRKDAEAQGQTSKLPTVRNSLLEVVREMCDLIPKLNVFDDPKLDELHDTIEKSLLLYNTEELRSDETMRENALSDVDALMQRAAAYMQQP